MFMKTVTMPLPIPPYHIALADVVYQDIVNGLSPIFASITLWNGLASLTQRGGTQQHVEEFLDRIASRLNPTPTSRVVPQPKFSGQSPDKTLQSVQEARQIAANYAPSSTPPNVRNENVAFKPIVEQIEIAKRMFQSPGGQQ
jgi:hypothetical protein